jgi:hypothetical protein
MRGLIRGGVNGGMSQTSNDGGSGTRVVNEHTANTQRHKDTQTFRRGTKGCANTS